MKLKINFRIEHNDARGIYHPDTNRVDIYPIQHENIEDMYYTIVHESIHYIIDQYEEEIDDDQEHRLIFAMQWAEEMIDG